MGDAVEMRPLWCKEECWNCGTEGYATRTIATPKSQPYHCSVCEYALKEEARARERVAKAVADARIEAFRQGAIHTRDSIASYVETWCSRETQVGTEEQRAYAAKVAKKIATGIRAGMHERGR